MYENYQSPVFITGCPRSGTSLYCGCLERCGANGGKVCGATSANPKGQYENSSIRNKIIKPYLKKIGADPLGQFPLPAVDELPSRPGLRDDFYWMLVEQGLQPNEIWYMKVCKACLIWPVFNEAFPDAKWIIVRRNRDDIVKSCMKTSFMRKRLTELSWYDWVNVHEERFGEMKSAMPDRVMEVWPSELVQGSFSNIRKSVEWIGLDWNEEAISKWVDETLWHGE